MIGGMSINEYNLKIVFLIFFIIFPILLILIGLPSMTKINDEKNKYKSQTSINTYVSAIKEYMNQTRDYSVYINL